MRRNDFLKELGTSLFDTVKSVYEPFFKDDLERVEEAADRILGITWIPITVESESCSDLEMKFVHGKPIILTGDITNRVALEGICPNCSQIITVITLNSSGKCLNCQKEYNFKTQTGELKLKSLPLKKKNQRFFVGFTHS